MPFLYVRFFYIAQLLNEIIERVPSKLKFHTGIGEHFARGDGRDTNEHRLDSHPAANLDVSEARTRGAQEAGELAARHIGRFHGD